MEYPILLHLFNFSRVSQPVKGVSQNINYTTTALLPVLTSLFDHVAQHQFGDDVIRKDLQYNLSKLNRHTCTLHIFVYFVQFVLWYKLSLYVLFSSVDDLQMSCYRIMCSIYSLGTVKTPHAERFV